MLDKLNPKYHMLQSSKPSDKVKGMSEWEGTSAVTVREQTTLENYCLGAKCCHCRLGMNEKKSFRKVVLFLAHGTTPSCRHPGTRQVPL
ncbi:Partitioning Defective 6-like Alpha [Manis pentadactyla]|nr:Partitioning Defective 6-like Alpha [Manis pentadactyla]